MRNPREILQTYWGYPDFRPLQEEIIQSVLLGRDTLALLPTGGGKSLCFQIPALCLDGICIVVSPLIALMKDQVEQLTRRDIKAVAIFSGMTRREIDIALDNCIYGDVKFLYVSPERLKTEIFLERANQMNISLLAVDEAHCISQWGYDFRPPYLEIVLFKKAMNIDRVIALTATATRYVKGDIIDKLEMGSPATFQKSFARKNLSYSVFNLENKEQKLLEILKKVPGSAIVYARSRKRTQLAANFLARNGILADYYHAGLSAKTRAEKQDQWIDNRIRVIVATNAFGMGIDKPDVRAVIHIDLPDSLEAYYQEAGRAGRDEQKAYAVALYHTQDVIELKERAEQSVVPLQDLKRVYRALANYYKMAVGSVSYSSFDFHFEDFVNVYHLPSKITYLAIKKLNDEGLIQLTEGFHEKSKLIFLLDRSEIYKYQVANATLDELIKVVLRLYGGEAFSGYVFINEADLGKMLKIDLKEVKRQLAFLRDQQVIDYRSASEVPQLAFITPRQDPDQLTVNKKQLKFQRKQAIEKAKAVVDYVQSLNCRTNSFQMYFDEKPDGICGICDNDIDKKKMNDLPSTAEIHRILRDAPKSLSDLKEAMSHYKEAQIAQVLRILLEDQDIVEENGMFRAN